MRFPRGIMGARSCAELKTPPLRAAPRSGSGRRSVDGYAYSLLSLRGR